MSSFGGYWYPCFGFLVTYPLGFKARLGSDLFTFAKAHVMYIPWDPPLVLHVLTSWQPALQPVTSPHACAEVGCGSDSNGQSPRQKTNALPLCQRPGLLSPWILISKVNIRSYMMRDSTLTVFMVSGPGCPVEVDGCWDCSVVLIIPRCLSIVEANANASTVH